MVAIEIASQYGYVLAVAIVYLLELFAFGILVSNLRKKHKVPYPDVTGPPEFNRGMRAHYNSLEGAPLFLVTLFISGLWWAEVSALAGVLYIVARALYAKGYVIAPEKRMVGGLLSHIAELVLLVGSGIFTYRLITATH